MTNEITATTVNVSINENQTAEERAEAEAILAAALAAQKEVRREQLTNKASQAYSRLAISVSNPEYAEYLQTVLNEAREMRALLVEDALTIDFDTKVLALAYEMVKTNNRAHIYSVMDVVRTGLPAKFCGGSQQQLMVYIKLALVEYVLACAIHDDEAREAAQANKNAGSQNFAVESKIENALYGQATPEEAIEAATLEVNRQVWCAILGKSEHALYLKTACENLATALLTSESPAHLQLLKLRTLLGKIRHGG